MVLTWIYKGTKDSLAHFDIHRESRLDWSDSHVAESSTELGVTVSIRGIWWCIMNTSVRADSSDLSVFLCSCLDFFPTVTCFLFSPPPLPSHNYHHAIFHIPPSHFDFHAFSYFASLCFLPLFPCLDPPPVPRCHIITMSPWEQPSVPCIFPTREADVEATIVS